MIWRFGFQSLVQRDAPLSRFGDRCPYAFFGTRVDAIGPPMPDQDCEVYAMDGVDHVAFVFIALDQTVIAEPPFHSRISTSMLPMWPDSHICLVPSSLGAFEWAIIEFTE